MRVVWKPISGYSGMYWVSTDGRVRSYRWWKQCGTESKGKPRLLSFTANEWGHLFVRLFQDGKTKSVPIGKLMLSVFLGADPDPKKKWALHNDGNPANNVLTYLRWGTNSENQMDRVVHGTSNRGAANGRAKLSELQVIAIHKALASGRAQRKIASEFGVDPSAISNIARGRNWPQLHPTFLASGVLPVAYLGTRP